MIELTEFSLNVPGSNDDLFVQRWKPSNTATALGLVITHGIAEHSDCYQRTAEALAPHGIEIFGWDLPGHGKSYGQRGYISGFDEFTSCLDLVVQQMRKLLPAPTPMILLGHSMGGLITLKYVLDNPRAPIDGISLSSPAMGIAVKVPAIKDQAARLLRAIAPRITLSEQLIFEDLSRDRSITDTYYRDPLRHKKVSAPLYLGMLEAMDEVRRRAHQLLVPVLLQQAGQDRIVDAEAAKALFEKIGSPRKRLKVYPDSFHEIFNDTNRKEVIDDLLEYLREFYK